MRTVDLLNELEEQAFDLLRYCHSTNCDNIEECPRKCCPDKHLNLGTAVAWTTGNMLLEFVNAFEYYDAGWLHRECLMQHRVLAAVFKAVSLDKANNPYLFFLVEKAFCSLTRLLNKIEEEK